MQLDIFHFDFSKENFESFARENGFTYWWASDLMVLLGYESETSFAKAINKAMTTCNTLNIPIPENFEQVLKIDENKKNKTSKYDTKLSRFACYLVVMNSDPKKAAVAKAQVYFATIAGAVQDYIQEVDKIERVVIRDEVTEREKSLHGVAHQAGVSNYAFFQNAGYRGMYNKSINQLKSLRKIDNSRTLLDYMGKEELAANLFRITQTELKIKQEQITGQSRLEVAAESVGRKVRKTMIEISNVAPENLPKKEDIKKVKSELKAKNKEFKRIDKPKKKK